MPRINPYDRTHLSRLTGYERKILRLYNEVVRKAALAASSIQGFNSEDVFCFDDHPILRTQVDKLLAALNQSVRVAIVNGIEAEWTLANNKNNELARQVFGDSIGELSQDQYRRYFSTNDSALQAFLSRNEGGLDLSQRVWKCTGALKPELEMGIGLGIRNGLSAAEMSRDLRHFLQHPDALFRRVRDEYGRLRLSKAAADFHPGRGVYRSSYMNARRLAATETNIAYHTADYERWRQMDFVVGIRVVLSNNHTVNGMPLYDICDELSAPPGSEATKGRGCYPKDFKFTGWHPHCRCHAVSILKTEEEMAADNARILNWEKPSESSVNTVTKLPESYQKWIEDNGERIKKARTMPYFITDNEGLMNGEFLDRACSKTRQKAMSVGDEVQGLAGKVAGRYGAVCTPINFKGVDSMKRKVLSERSDLGLPSFSPDRLKDTVRTTIVADRDKIEDILDSLSSEDCFLRLKRQNTSMGYTGNIVNITTSSGLTAEIQVNTARMIYAKENPDVAQSIIGKQLWNKIRRETGQEGGLGHTFYEKWRVLDPKSREAKEILKKSREYYSHFTS